MGITDKPSPKMNSNRLQLDKPNKKTFLSLAILNTFPKVGDSDKLITEISDAQEGRFSIVREFGCKAWNNKLTYNDRKGFYFVSLAILSLMLQFNSLLPMLTGYLPSEPSDPSDDEPETVEEPASSDHGAFLIHNFLFIALPIFLSLDLFYCPHIIIKVLLWQPALLAMLTCTKFGFAFPSLVLVWFCVKIIKNMMIFCYRFADTLRGLR